MSSIYPSSVPPTCLPGRPYAHRATVSEQLKSLQGMSTTNILPVVHRGHLLIAARPFGDPVDDSRSIVFIRSGTHIKPVRDSGNSLGLLPSPAPLGVRRNIVLLRLVHPSHSVREAKVVVESHGHRSVRVEHIDVAFYADL